MFLILSFLKVSVGLNFGVILEVLLNRVDEDVFDLCLVFLVNPPVLLVDESLF
jgi:hypothetical protein